MEAVNAALVPKETQSQVGELVFSAEDHELKVVVHVESTKGERAAEVHETGPPNKRRKQERGPDTQIAVHFSLCDDSSDQGANSVDDSAELERGPRR